MRQPCAPPRHCEEPLRRSNPDYHRGRILDCFAALAMTGNVAAASFPNATARSAPFPASARHALILQTHGPTKDAAFACLIVIGLHPNPV
ncbi:hypothetical protein EOW77_0015110 [Bradyrhizobium yuanmingense]|nr:hypothetical protein EOW77_0015110 [Bradyrhizobium yuanmingense]